MIVKLLTLEKGVKPFVIMVAGVLQRDAGGVGAGRRGGRGRKTASVAVWT
jgi:hypothetical protein